MKHLVTIVYKTREHEIRSEQFEVIAREGPTSLWFNLPEELGDDLPDLGMDKDPHFIRNDGIHQVILFKPGRELYVEAEYPVWVGPDDHYIQLITMERL